MTKAFLAEIWSEAKRPERHRAGLTLLGHRVSRFFIAGKNENCTAGNEAPCFDMSRIGYAPRAFDLFDIGHLNLLREARSRCDFLIASVVIIDVLVAHKGIRPIIPVSERLEIKYSR